MATITVRALNPITWEPLYGNGQNCFISDLQAVAQILAQRLKLFQGEWWENLDDGLPLFQSILGSSAGQKNLQVITNLISARILGTVYVTSISSLTISYESRVFKYSSQAETQFGTVYLTNTPASSATV
jgi:hypothetical protein